LKRSGDGKLIELLLWFGHWLTHSECRFLIEHLQPVRDRITESQDYKMTAVIGA
jgi:hypothetical protein